MEIIGAAALIAVGIVVAAMVYGRIHGASVPAGAAAARGAVASQKPAIAGAAAVQAEAHERTAELAQREAGLARREAELARREAEIERDRAANAALLRDGLEAVLPRLGAVGR